MTDDELADVLDGLHAYDVGAVDSGIKDEDLRWRALAELSGRPDGTIEKLAHQLYLDPERRALGYGNEDAEEFREWLADQL
jgi:hypothetical protein